MVDSEPVSINEAIKKKVWVNAMKEDIKAIERNKTWELTIPPQKKKGIRMRWIFKIKLKPDGSVAKHKSRLVARGLLQKYGLDYFEVFAHVARHGIIRLIIAIVANRNWPRIHLDVNSDFLDYPLQEEVYVLQTLGFVKENKEGMVYKLHKALYGLKQAPRAWNLKIHSFFKHLVFKKCEMEYVMDVQHTSDGNVIIVCLYVDDILMTWSCTSERNKFKKVLMNEFDMTDLENMVYFLGMEIFHYEKGINVHQVKYELELLKILALLNCKSAVTPAETNHKLDSDDYA